NTNLVLWERLSLCGLPIHSRAKISGEQHDKECAVNCILRPPEGRRPEVLANVLALLTSANKLQYASSHRMFGDIAVMAYLRHCPYIAATRPCDNLSPVSMVGLRELREQTFQCVTCGILNLVSELDSVCLLSTAQKHFRPTNDLTQQFLNPMRGHFEVR